MADLRTALCTNRDCFRIAKQCRDDTLTDNPESLFLDIKHIARLCILDESEGVQVSTDDDSSCSILEGR